MKKQHFGRNIADELDSTAYGENFYNALKQFLLEEKLDKKTVRDIIEALVDADEIRDCFSVEIQTLLFQRIKSGKPVRDVLEFLRYCCSIYTTDEQNSYIAALFSKMQEYVDLDNAFYLMKQDFSETPNRMLEAGEK